MRLRHSGIGFGLLLLGSACGETRVAIDGNAPGRAFAGIGALSAGASSRLLIDYPEPRRSEILDYLFKPGFGAGLNILKVEIGGDMNSTDGSEPSQEHVRGQEDYNRGYEWWLMQQAKARNPAIKLAGLAWGAPGWIGNGNYWSQDNIDFQIRWLKHAKADHGLDLDYMGGWNEKGFNAQWLIDFKKALRANGFSAKLVAADDIHNWDVFTAMQGNPALMEAVDIVGRHYPCGWLGKGTTCSSPEAARLSGKELWASEEGSQPYNVGAANLAKAINRDYIDGRMVAVINWSLIWSAYANLPFEGDGLMLANTPWSGHYEVGKSIWVCAHTTQFAQPGWRYLDTACGFLGGVRANGSYVTLRSPVNGDYSIVVETVDAGADQPFTFTPGGGLAGGAVHVWSTDLVSDNPADHFARLADLQPANGAYAFTLKKGHLYTFTTTTGQVKGATQPPPAKPMAIPYADAFEGYAPGKEARYFSDMNGSFDTAPCSGRAGGCLAQTVPLKPILWNGFTGVHSMIGDPDWADYQVQCDVLLQQAGAVRVLGRISRLNNQTALPGYVLEASDSGNGSWRLLLARSDRSESALATGKKAFAVGTWHTLKLVLHGPDLEGWIDGTKVAAVRDTTFARGNAGIGVGGWTLAQFDDFSVSAPGSVVALGRALHESRTRDATGNLQGTPAIWSAPKPGAAGSKVDARGKVLRAQAGPGGNFR